MQTTDYIWHNGNLVPWHEATIHVLTHSLHYGSAAFEGIRVYATEKGPAIFRLKEHIQRLFYSAAAIDMKLPYTEEQLATMMVELVAKNKLEHGYIRPIAYYGYGKMGVSPKGAPVELSIACWPWGAYLPVEAVDIKTSKYPRIPFNCTITDAKLSGNYLNGVLGSIEINGTHYHETLHLDIEGYIAEGPGENFFIVKDQKIITPKLGSILAGITRDTVFTIIKNFGYSVTEENISLQEAYEADEAFFTGTAAEVTPIRSIDDKVIGKGIGEITLKIQREYLGIVHGKNPAYTHYLTYVASA